MICVIALRKKNVNRSVSFFQHSRLCSSLCFVYCSVSVHTFFFSILSEFRTALLFAMLFNFLFFA